MPKPLLTKKRLAALDEVVREAFALQQARRYPEAEARYRAVLTVHPHHFDALHMLGLICHALGRRAEALTVIGAALKVKALPDAFSNHGLVLNALQRYEEALASFDRALKLRPDYAEVLANRGNALLRLERLEAALDCYTRAVALRPDYLAARRARASGSRSVGGKRRRREAPSDAPLPAANPMAGAARNSFAPGAGAFARPPPPWSIFRRKPGPDLIGTPVRRRKCDQCKESETRLTRWPEARGALSTVRWP